MDIVKMKTAIQKKCIDYYPMCSDNGGCPLFGLVDKTSCWECDTDEEVIKNYNLMFPSGTQAPCVDTTAPVENVNHPNHYNREGSIECIEEMLLVFGRERVKNFCLCNVWKYRYRAADKNGVEDLKKSDWYMRKYKELCSNG